MLEERERRTVGERHAADGLRKTAELSAADYERRMHEIRVKLAADAEATLKAIEAEEHARSLSDARDQASGQLMQLRDRLAPPGRATRVRRWPRRRTPWRGKCWNACSGEPSHDPPSAHGSRRS